MLHCDTLGAAQLLSPTHALVAFPIIYNRLCTCVLVYYCTRFTRNYLRMCSPSVSLPPGHFCGAVISLAKVAGHVIFQVLSCSEGHPND